MSAVYWEADGTHVALKDEEGQKFAYHVAENSGVLVVLQRLDDKPWEVYREISPSGWHQAAGTRYPKYPSGAPGVDGKVTFGSARLVQS